MSILNLTQHLATQQQQAEGVKDMLPQHREQLVKLLTFNELPTHDEIFNRATELVILASKYSCEYVMLGGAPYLMAPLERAIAIDMGKSSVFAFSKRVSKEITNSVGEVIKTNTFVHEGFVGLPESYIAPSKRGCIYCGSPQCVAYTMGESVCG